MKAREVVANCDERRRAIDGLVPLRTRKLPSRFRPAPVNFSLSALRHFSHCCCPVDHPKADAWDSTGRVGCKVTGRSESSEGWTGNGTYARCSGSIGLNGPLLAMLRWGRCRYAGCLGGMWAIVGRVATRSGGSPADRCGT